MQAINTGRVAVSRNRYWMLLSQSLTKENWETESPDHVFRRLITQGWHLNNNAPQAEKFSRLREDLSPVF
jgi:hypothetical protein